MPLRNDPAYQLAKAIQRRYAQDSQKATPTDVVSLSWQRCLKLSQRLHIVQSRGWNIAARHVQTALKLSLEEHASEVQACLRTLTSRESQKPPITVRTIYDELCALDDEFTEVKLDQRGKTLSVVTEPVILEDVYLGAFEIQLDWAGLPEQQSYDVIALDARPAALSESTTHPHVQENVLCSGEAKVPISRALAEGRLLDFFQIVNNTLHTYNSSSAYVALEDWDGIPCADCGTGTNEDYRTSCAACDCTLCDGCASSCNDCCDSLCCECSCQCRCCDDVYCRHCLKTCPHCSARVCSSCQDSENERCQLCHEEDSEECKVDRPATTSTPPQSARANASAAVQPAGVVETLVPAGLR